MPSDEAVYGGLEIDGRSEDAALEAPLGQALCPTLLGFGASYRRSSETGAPRNLSPKFSEKMAA